MSLSDIKKKIYDFTKIKTEFLSNITDITDINKLKIHVLLDYKDFDKKTINEPEILKNLTEKYESEMNPIYMFNFSSNGLKKFYTMHGSDPKALLLPNNITFAELTEIIQELNTKFVKGGSRITKRALPKNKKHKTEKKKN